MRSQGRIRRCLTWFCLTAALLLACAWLATRFIAIDIQTGTRLALSLDQGAAIFVTGDVPFDASFEVEGHDADQVGWQWWFATYPHSFVLPLWLPLMTLVTAGAALRAPRSVSSPQPSATFVPAAAH